MLVTIMGVFPYYYQQGCNEHSRTYGGVSPGTAGSYRGTLNQNSCCQVAHQYTRARKKKVLPLYYVAEWDREENQIASFQFVLMFLS